MSNISSQSQQSTNNDKINDSNKLISVSSSSQSNSTTLKKLTKSFANNLYSKTIHQLTRKFYKCLNSKTYNDFPIDSLADLDSNVFANYSGPDNGIAEIDQPKLKNQQQQPMDSNNLINEYFESLVTNGLSVWNRSHHKAYGISASLYESNPITNLTIGEPIADTFAILARPNNCILLMADGVNWGFRSRRASRCAVRAALNYINKYLFFEQQQQQVKTTHDLFRILSKAFDEAQEFIVKREGSMTTLCCSIVVQLKENSSQQPSSSSSTSSSQPTSSHHHSPIYAVCTLSIGDSTAYVYSREKGLVYELTKGSRNTQNDRDMRDVGGALGYVHGKKPDLSNMNYSIMYIKQNDIVFLVSDGISDNFDPVVSGVARKKMTTASNNNNNGNYNSESLPEMDPFERYLCSLTHMNEILMRNRTLNETISAQETCAMLMEHVVKLTQPKRQLLENGFAEAAKITSDEERLKFQIKLREDVQKLHGKLDHASIVAFEV